MLLIFIAQTIILLSITVLFVYVNVSLTEYFVYAKIKSYLENRLFGSHRIQREDILPRRLDLPPAYSEATESYSFLTRTT